MKGIPRVQPRVCTSAPRQNWPPKTGMAAPPAVGSTVPFCVATRRRSTAFSSSDRVASYSGVRSTRTLTAGHTAAGRVHDGSLGVHTNHVSQIVVSLTRSALSLPDWGTDIHAHVTLEDTLRAMRARKAPGVAVHGSTWVILEGVQTVDDVALVLLDGVGDGCLAEPTAALEGQLGACQEGSLIRDALALLEQREVRAAAVSGLSNLVGEQRLTIGARPVSVHDVRWPAAREAHGGHHTATREHAVRVEEETLWLVLVAGRVERHDSSTERHVDRGLLV